MKLRYSGLAALVAAVVAVPVASQAAPQTCTAGKATPASYTWNFPTEASQLLNGIQQDANKAEDRASTLDMFTMNSNIDWQIHAFELNALRREVNDMGRKLCRLEEIRRVAAPWQRKAIDAAAPDILLMADNTGDAIHFANEYQNNFWRPSYRKNVRNVLQESGQLNQSMKTFEQLHREQASTTNNS